MVCSLEESFLSSDCVKWMGWIGGSCFALLIITFWCILMASFPGYSNLAKLQEWYYNTFDQIFEWSSIIWGLFNILSTIVTIVGIYKIMKTMQQLKKSNTSIKTNYLQLTMHALVLTLNLIPVIIDSLPFKWLTSF